MTLFFGKGRHFISEFQRYNLKLHLMRVKTAKNTFAYEIDIFIRKKYDWLKVGSVQQQDVDHLYRLLHEVEAYVNGLR